MTGNDRFSTFYTGAAGNSKTADQIREYAETVARRKQMGLPGDGTDGSSFAAKLRQADEYLASGEKCGATDSIGIILRRMGEPAAGSPITQEVYHNGVRVVVTKDALCGNSITIGGSANPDWIHVNTSVGTVNIDLNDTESLMKCLDMFSPEDITAIMHKILEVKQARDALREIDETVNGIVETEREV